MNYLISTKAMRVLKLLVANIGLMFILSCTPSPPYEVRSPCVSNEIDTISNVNPCVRRPVGQNIS